MSQPHNKRYRLLEKELSNVGKLRFTSADLEESYTKHFEGSNLFRHRMASVMAVIALLIFMVQDLYSFPDESIVAYLVIRAGICIPLFIIGFILSLIPRMQQLVSYWMVVSLLLLGLGNVAVIVINHINNHISPYEGIILTVIGGQFLVGLNFKSATLCSIAMLISYLVSVLVFQNNAQGFYNLSFVISTVVICVGGGYEMEKQLRINFIKNEILTIISERDGLTGVYNRSSLEKKLKQVILSSIRERKGIALAMIDVDFFKNYNDCYGHIAGDECLRSIAMALTKCCHRSTDFCARYGGEEFVLVWNPTKPYAPQTLLENIQQEINRLSICHEASEVSKYITLSGGIVYFEPTRPIDNKVLFLKADKALYAAKKAGRNQFQIVLQV